MKIKRFLTTQVPHPPLRGTFPQEGKENKEFPSPLGRPIAELPAPGAPKALMRGQGEGSGQLQFFFNAIWGGVIVVLLLGTSASVWAGAWTLDPGRWYSEVGTNFYWDDSSFDENGNERDTPFQGGYSEFATKIYVEYGLKPRLNLISSINHKVVEYTDDYSKLTNSGIQDGVLAVKWRFTEQPVVFSGIVGTHFPLGYSTQRDPELGSGEWNPEARLSVGKTFVAMPPSESGVRWSRFYANAELAKDKRSLLSTLEGGFFATSWLMAKGLLSGARDLPSQPDGQEFNKWNLSLNIASDGTGLLTRQGENKSFNLSVGYGKIFDGRNVGAGSEWTTSVSMGF